MEGINLEIKGKEIILRKKLNKDEIYKVINKRGFFQLNIFSKPQWTVGITSMCEDGTHVLFLDYDSICKWIMIRDLKNLVEQEGRSTFYVLRTKEEKINGELIGNYQAICLDKLTPAEVVDYQRMTHCDKSYVTMPRRTIYHSWVLRATEKGKRDMPKLDSVVGENKNLDNPISTAHYTWLLKQYKIVPSRYTEGDGLKKLFKNTYETLNRLK